MSHSNNGTPIRSPFTRAMLAGALAGTTVDLTLFPLDTLRTRLQSSSGFQSSGGFRGIYAGIGSCLIGSAPGAALFFVSYESAKSFLRDARFGHVGKTGNERGKGEGFEHMVAATIGEVAACAIRVPTEVVKQRAQAGQHPNSLSALQHILMQRHSTGLLSVRRELYRGWNATIMREVPFTVIQFPLWESMKTWRRHTSGREGISALESGMFGSMAGAVAAGVTTPLDVVKTRIMLSQEKKALGPLLGDIWNQSGPKSFFAGFGPRVLWIAAGGAIFLGSYQWAYNVLAGVR